MPAVVIRAELLAQLTAAGGEVQVTDPAGNRVGRFVPYPAGEPTEAECRAMIASAVWVPAERVEARLRELTKCE